MFSRGRCFALDERMKLDIEAIKSFLSDHAGKTIFMFGFTSVIWADFLKGLEDQGQRLDLTDAFLLHGGGWKKLENERVSNNSFKVRIEQLTGCHRIHNYYGMVEQTGTIFMSAIMATCMRQRSPTRYARPCRIAPCPMAQLA